MSIPADSDEPTHRLKQDDWTEKEHLRELHVNRGWTATDIAQIYDVEAATVRYRLKEVELFQGRTRPPKSGLARKIWEHGLEQGGEI